MREVTVMHWTTSLIFPRHTAQGWNWHHGLGASRPTTWLPGFVGPVPPPLWIRACSVFNCEQIIAQTSSLVKRPDCLIRNHTLRGALRRTEIARGSSAWDAVDVASPHPRATRSWTTVLALTRKPAHCCSTRARPSPDPGKSATSGQSVWHDPQIMLRTRRSSRLT